MIPGELVLHAPGRHHITERVGTAIDEAIDTVAPGEDLTWDLSIAPMVDPMQGMVLQAWLTLVGPSLTLGESLMSVMSVDPRRIGDPAVALDTIRHLVGELRTLRASMAGNVVAPAALHIPGRPS